MNYSTGKLAFIVVAAVVLAFIAASVIAGSYRAAMRHLTNSPSAPRDALAPAVAPDPAQSTLPPQPVNAQDNHRALLHSLFVSAPWSVARPLTTN